MYNIDIEREADSRFDFTALELVDWLFLEVTPP